MAASADRARALLLASGASRRYRESRYRPAPVRSFGARSSYSLYSVSQDSRARPASRAPRVNRWPRTRVPRPSLYRRPRGQLEPGTNAGSHEQPFPRTTVRSIARGHAADFPDMLRRGYVAEFANMLRRGCAAVSPNMLRGLSLDRHSPLCLSLCMSSVETEASMSEIREVHAVGFRHRTPGEGVGGTEWDVEPGAAKKRVDVILANDSHYETLERTVSVEPFELPLDDSTRERVTTEVDDWFWMNWDETTRGEEV